MTTTKVKKKLSKRAILKPPLPPSKRKGKTTDLKATKRTTKKVTKPAAKKPLPAIDREESELDAETLARIASLKAFEGEMVSAAARWLYQGRFLSKDSLLISMEIEDERPDQLAPRPQLPLEFKGVRHGNYWVLNAGQRKLTLSLNLTSGFWHEPGEVPVRFDLDMDAVED